MKVHRFRSTWWRRAFGAAALGVLVSRGYSQVRTYLARDTQLLTTVEETPTRDQLVETFGPDAASELAALLPSDFKERTATIKGLRALHALRLVPGSKDALRAAVAQYAASGSGVGRVYLRVGIESLGFVGDGDDLQLLTSFLSHEQRDVRATAALALLQIGDPAALPALRAQAVVETSEQVELAILRAIRGLE